MHPEPGAILSTFTAGDGANLALHDWTLDDDAPARGMVLVVHGLGEHAGRYGQLARELNAAGFHVRGFDQYGHGESDGARGRLTSAARLLDDLGDVLASSRARLDPSLPLVLLGHSMGGLVAALHVALHGAQPPTHAQALVLSSPAFDPGLSAVQKLLLATLPRIAPDLAVGNGVDPQLLSHDPEVVAAYRADRNVHGRISGRLGRFIAQGGTQVLARAADWTIPTLLMYAGCDGVVDARGSRAFAAAAPPGVVTAHCFDDLYHEIFNELDAGPVFDALRAWLDARFPSAGAVPATAAPPR